MEQEQIQEVLAKNSFFNGLRAHTLTAVAGCARVIEFEPSTYLFYEGDPADSFFLLTSGQVAIQVAAGSLGMQTIASTEGGDVLGWSWVVEPYRWHFSGRALAHGEALRIDARCLRGKFESDPALGLELMQRFVRIIAQRLTATRIQMVDYMA